ncbi:MAG: response regulator, partial [Lachnospiraceae bacterium]|nr:response regulator [Lachnospiraceae bacterium]
TLDDAMKVSKHLMLVEYHAMHLIAPKRIHKIVHEEIGGCQLTPGERKMSFEQRHERAEELLWDDEYIRHKIEIYTCLSKGLGEASAQAMERHQQLRKDLLNMLALCAISLISLVMALCGFVFYRRYQHERMVEVQAKKNARMNVRLKEERDKSIKAEKAKSYFFSTVSHDIRTPLNSIIGFSEMLQLGIDDPEENKKALDAIMTSGHTLLELINDVLDLSKLESGKMELHPVPTDIATLVDRVAVSFEAAVSRISVRLYTEVGKMPFLKLDPQRIRQILFNLIGNAVKFTSKGSITVRAAYDDSTFTLSVTDTGCGISEENIGKLMAPYVQLQTHDSTKGTGLGLAICKQLSMQMGGALEIESTPGKGSTFTLRIPNVQALSEQESEAYFREHKPPAATTQLDETVMGKCILIVDDQKLTLRILQTMLSRLGIRKVLTSVNGREALDVLRDAGDVEMVLTDMSMPVMDGEELVREIRKKPRFDAIPVYVITADVEMQSEYRKIGFDDMLIKPITLDKLRQ